MTNRCPEPSCHFFDRVIPINANVCPMCGTLLKTVNESQNSSTSEDRFSLPQLSKNFSRPQLRLSHPSGRHFDLAEEAGKIGRRDRDSGNVPEIDLDGIPDEGIVSRFHANLYWDRAQQAYMIVDNSRNGSYLNGNLLTSGSPYRLNHGDELELGQNQLVRLKVLLI